MVGKVLLKRGCVYMDKIIKLKMTENKNIEISVNDKVEIEIKKGARKIQAGDLYRLFGYSSGDTFNVIVENESNYDAPVINFFADLISEVVKKIVKVNDDFIDTDNNFVDNNLS